MSAEGYNGLTETQESLPASYYLDAEHHERELQAVWYRSWIYVCRSEELENSRSFRTFEIGNQNILLLRDDQGCIRAFHNTCRHRGSILCEEPRGRLRSSALVCPYHRWCYSLRGDLLNTSSRQNAADFDKSSYGLHRIAVHQWQGFLFINLAGEQVDDQAFTDALEIDSSNLDNWPMQSLKIGHRYRKVLNCNWKVFWENYNECLHCPHVHPGLSALVPIYSRAYMSPGDSHDWELHRDSNNPKFAGGLKSGAQTFSANGQPVAETFAGLTDDEKHQAYHYVTSLPSAFVVAHVDHVRVVRVLPLGPEQTEIQAEWLFAEDTLTDDSADIQPVVDFAIQVMEEDGRISETNQKGMRSLRFDHGVLMPEEYAVFDFQNWVRERLKTSKQNNK